MKKYIIGGSVLFILFILILYSHSVIGIPAKHIEVDARKSQQIAENWLVAQSIN